MFRAKKQELVTIDVVPDREQPHFERAQTLMVHSIGILRNRGEQLREQISRDQAELDETDRTMRALLEAEAKLMPDVDTVALDRELSNSDLLQSDSNQS